jgi:hypothetical protein
MIVTESKFGRFKKDGVSYTITREDGDSKFPRAWALDNDYTVDTLHILRQDKAKEISKARYEAEFGGFTEPNTGLFVRTDNRTRTLLNNAMFRAKEDPAYIVPNWKTADGTFITLNAPTIIALADAIHTFIEAQFAKEAALSAAIDAAITLEELNSISWNG